MWTKTAEKCWKDPKFLESKLKDSNALQQYQLNRNLIDFKNIPTTYKQTYIVKYLD